VRQSDQIKPALPSADGQPRSDQVGQPWNRIDELGNGQAADRDHEPGLEDLKFRLHPRTTILDFGQTWNSVAIVLPSAGKTSAHRCKINPGTNLGFAQAGNLFEPTKHVFARRPGKRTARGRFSYSRSLANQNDLAKHRFTGHRNRLHQGAAATFAQSGDVLFKSHLARRH
jgi:hypothetical protein